MEGAARGSSRGQPALFILEGLESLAACARRLFSGSPVTAGKSCPSVLPSRGSRGCVFGPRSLAAKKGGLILAGSVRLGFSFPKRHLAAGGEAT